MSKAELPDAIEVAHLDGRGGVYWLPAKRISASYPDSLQSGKHRFSYEITLAPPGWQGIPFGGLAVNGEGTYWRRPAAAAAPANEGRPATLPSNPEGA